jgi:uncharacterized protein with GYD domain
VAAWYARGSANNRVAAAGRAKTALIDVVAAAASAWVAPLIRDARGSFRPDALIQRRPPMPLYLARFSYTTDAMKALIDQPQDRSVAAREVAETLGGKLLGFWYAFGEFDGVYLMEAPDNASAAAVAMAVGASGALSEVETTVLLDMDEAQDAMRKAAAAAYRPPGGFVRVL